MESQEPYGYNTSGSEYDQAQTEKKGMPWWGILLIVFGGLSVIGAIVGCIILVLSAVFSFWWVSTLL